MAMIKGFLLDMDGVLYHGDHALPHAAELMTWLQNWPFCCITNNPTRSASAVVDKLSRLGFNGIGEGQIITSAEATANWLAEQKPDFRYFAVGATGLHEALARKGQEDHDRADFVVVGEGAIDYEDLVIGINLVLQRDAVLVGTNPDASVDGSRGSAQLVLPGGGALMAPFSVATGRTPLFVGKPEAPLYLMALERLGLSPGECLMIGDRPDTDILGAQRLGMPTALVRTGRFPPGEALPSAVSPPNIDVDDLPSLHDALRRIQSC